MAPVKSIGNKGSFLIKELKKKIYSFPSYGKEEDNIVLIDPKKSGKVTDIIFGVDADEKPVLKIINHAIKNFGTIEKPKEKLYDSYEFGRIVRGKKVTHKVNFIKKKVSKKTPTKVFEKGTTEVFNQALHNNKKFKSASDILNDKETRKELNNIFKGYEDALSGWVHTYYEQQKEFLKEFGKNEWSVFEYDNKKDFVSFFSDQIKRVGRTLTKDKDGKMMVIEPVGRYEVWNPSDIWAAYKLPQVQKDIRDNLSPETQSLAELNTMLIDMFEKKRLVGISLKLIGPKKEAKLVYRNDKPENMKIANIEKLEFRDIKFKLDNIWQKAEKGGGTVYADYGKSFGVNFMRTDSGIAFSTQVKGTSAQGGNTPVDMVVKLLEKNISNNTYTKDINKYPKNFEEFAKEVDEYEKLYNIIKPYFNGAPPFGGTDNSFVMTLDKAFSAKSQTGKLGVNGTAKLMFIKFFGNAFKIRDQDKKKEFWTDILYLGMKVGEKGEFAPHIKIGEKTS